MSSDERFIDKYQVREMLQLIKQLGCAPDGQAQYFTLHKIMNVLNLQFLDAEAIKEGTYHFPAEDQAP